MPIALTIHGDTPCPECGYNLRGLARGRQCPECGTNATFFGPRRIRPKQALRLGRRLKAPVYLAAVSILLWSGPMDRVIARDRDRLTGLAFWETILALFLAWWIWPDLRRFVHLRRRGVRWPPTTAYLAFNFLLIALMLTLWAVALAVPTELMAPLALFVCVMLAAFATATYASAALLIPSLLRRRRRSEWRRAAVHAIVAAAGIYACLSAMIVVFGQGSESLIPRRSGWALPVFLAWGLGAWTASKATNELRQMIGLTIEPGRPVRRKHPRKVLVVRREAPTCSTLPDGSR